MKKKWIGTVLRVSMAFSMFAPMAFASSLPEKQAVLQTQGHTIEIGMEDTVKEIDVIANYFGFSEQEKQDF
ncbi:hypothetical protein, partial [Paenibacillus sp. KS1]|uniref:hypothetical protein n=1 Tax=Paenibacillus sp. KS1 TaxID=1849249 RepID=UPI0011124670